MTLSEYEEKTKQLIDFLDEMEKKLKKISEDLNKKPREFWIARVSGEDFVTYRAYPSKEDFYARGCEGIIELIHVKEVIDG